jgi:hypothetical protein
LIKSSNNGILGFKKVSINCQNPSVFFWQLIKILLMSFLVILKFCSTENSQKIWSTDYESFDQLIKHNFDQLNFGQMIPCQNVHNQTKTKSQKKKFSNFLIRNKREKGGMEEKIINKNKK